MLPVVLHETLTSAFSFYNEGQVYQGMSCQKRLYKLISTYTIKSRLQAYAMGCELSGHGNQVVITVSPEHYKVWVDLRSHAIAQPSPALQAD